MCGKCVDSTNEENQFNSVDLLDKVFLEFKVFCFISFFLIVLKIETFEKSEDLFKYGVTENDDHFEDMLEKSCREREQTELGVNLPKGLSGRSPPKSK